MKSIPYVSQETTAFCLLPEHVVVGNGSGKLIIKNLTSLDTFDFKGCHAKKISKIQVSNDHQLATSTSFDGKLNVYDMETLESVYSFEFQEPVQTQSLKEQQIAVGTTRSRVIRLCDLVSGANSQTLNGHLKPVTSLDWLDSTTNILASGSLDGKVMVWDIRNGRDSLFGLPHGTCAVNGLSFAECGTELTSTSVDGVVKTWDLYTGKVMTMWDLPQKPSFRSVYFCRIGGYTFFPSGTLISVYNSLGKEIASLDAHLDSVFDVQFDPATYNLVSGSAQGLLEWSIESSLRDKDSLIQNVIEDWNLIE